jgi:predicted nuclease with TOPRIM domain
MKKIKIIALFCMMASLVAVVGCGIPKEKYETLLNEKIVLEEKVNVLIRSKEALKKEYDDLLNEKMSIATKLETITSEKSAMKSEYDKILDEKISIKAAYDKLLAENKDLQDKLKQ